MKNYIEKAIFNFSAHRFLLKSSKDSKKRRRRSNRVEKIWITESNSDLTSKIFLESIIFFIKLSSCNFLSENASKLVIWIYVCERPLTIMKLLGDGLSYRSRYSIKKSLFKVSELKQDFSCFYFCYKIIKLLINILNSVDLLHNNLSRQHF